MPTLNWMGREKATNAVKDVLMKILREDKSLGYKSHAEKKGDATASPAGDNNILVHGIPSKKIILKEGDIVSMSIVSSTTGDDDFDKKIKADVSKWKFDRIKTGKTTVTIPFTFSEDDE